MSNERPAPTAVKDRVLILDVGGVILAEGALSQMFRALAEHWGLTPEQVESHYRHHLRDDLWSGSLKEPDFWRRLGGYCGADLDPEVWRRFLIARWTPLPAATRLSEWHERAEIWILSNHRGEWLRPMLEEHQLLGYFDRLFVSSEFGGVKPGPAAFRPVLAGLEGRPALFVDDQLSNVRAATRLGLPAMQATGAHWQDRVDHFVGCPLGMPALRQAAALGV
jgi:putative hydrolase of the HAD superfamily